MAERDIDLVLVTGAGASREFGQGGQKLPLMADWAQALIHKLAQRGNNLVEVVGLQPGLTGPEFEQRLGLFLHHSQIFPEMKRFIAPSMRAGVAVPVSEEGLETWFQHVESYIRSANDAIYESLHEEFGWNKVDPRLAMDSYEALLASLGVTPASRIVYATTNYDQLGEYALTRLRRLPDAGDIHEVHHGGAVQVEVAGLLDGLPRYTPVLHLHGRIGWFRQAGIVYSGPDRTSFDSSMATPVVMLPDPAKDYASDALIFELWEEFGRALDRARRVLVLGHSLGDEALLQALATHVDPLDRIAVTVLPPPGHPQGSFSDGDSTVLTARSRLPGAEIIGFRFDPGDLPRDAGPFGPWLSRYPD